MGVVIRQSVRSTVISYIGALIAFVSIMYVQTKFFSPEDIGLIKVILDIGMVFGLLAQLGTASSAQRFFPYFKTRDGRNNGFFFYIMLLPLIGCIVFVGLYLLLKGPVMHFFADNSALFNEYYYWVIPLIVITAYWAVSDTYSAINLRLVVPKFNREILCKVLTMAVYLFYGYMAIDRDGLVAGYILVQGVAMLLTFFYLFRVGGTSMKHDTSFISKPLRRDIARYTAYLIAGNLGGALMSKLDSFMVSGMMGLDSNGTFTIASYMAIVIEIPIRSITAISTPLAAESLKEGNFTKANDLYKKVSLHQLVAAGILFVIIWSNIDSIFAVIPNGNLFAAGKWVVFFIGMGKLIEVTLSFGGIMIGFSRYYHWSLYFTFIIIGLGIVANILLIPVLGITGAALATALGSLLSYSVQQWIVLRKIRGNPYSKGTFKAIAMLIVLFAVGWALPALDNSWLDIFYRTAVLGTLSVVGLYMFRISDEVKGLIREIIGKALMIK